MVLDPADEFVAEVEQAARDHVFSPKRVCTWFYASDLDVPANNRKIGVALTELVAQGILARSRTNKHTRARYRFTEQGKQREVQEQNTEVDAQS